MERGLLIRSPQPGWAVSAFEQLLPGGHACVFGAYQEALAAEEAGFEVRDCIVALGLGVQQRVWLLRKPIVQQNVAAQVLKTGTGGIWIDGCRVSVAQAELIEQTGEMVEQARGAIHEGYDRPGRTMYRFKPKVHCGPANPEGRWPPNLVFIHGPECRQQGTKRIKGGNDPRGKNGQLYQGGQFKEHGGFKTGYSSGHSGFADQDGLETVTAWECQRGCPVAALDQQSGERKTTYVAAHHQNNRQGEFLGQLEHPGAQGYNDTGGASRFFPQFANDLELDGWLQRLILGPEE